MKRKIIDANYSLFEKSLEFDLEKRKKEDLILVLFFQN